jgi:hypothetical protein
MHNAHVLLMFVGIVKIICSYSTNKNSSAKVTIRIMSFNIQLNTPADSANA